MSLAKSILFCSALVAFAAEASAVTMNWSPVGNPGNAGDPVGFGSGAVPYAYNIGTYDVTVRQYVEFLNVKDPTGTNTLGLYNSNMTTATFGGNSLGGVTFSAGNINGSKYGVDPIQANHPINSVT